MMKEKFTEEEYKLLQQDVETIRRLDEEIDKLEEMGIQEGDTVNLYGFEFDFVS